MKNEDWNSLTKKMKPIGFLAGLVSSELFGAGLLISEAGDPLHLEHHQVTATIEGAYAQVQWSQTFRNTGGQAVEAIYEVPLPEHATLGAVAALIGDQLLVGEVLPKAEAEVIYEEEKASGTSAGLVSQESFQRHRFALSKVPAGGTAVLDVTYYQPIDVEAGVGVFRYALEEGGIDSEMDQFWRRKSELRGNFSVEIEVRSGAPLASIRAPGFEAGHVEIVDASTQRFSWAGNPGKLDQDFVLYYMLEENLPGRVEVYTHKPSLEEEGTFMAVITPGIDLAPLNGQDYVFVLDLSGSMQGKLQTLLGGVEEALKTFSERDRFRIVLFNDRAEEWTKGWVSGTEENISRTVASLNQIKAGGGTNLYAGIKMGLHGLDSDRACSYILVTDAVANVGEIDPAHFQRLLGRYDIRFFGFLLGNSANTPLMNQLCASTGGYSRSVSNAQDIVGEILLAQSKVAYQSLHDARFRVGGSSRPYGLVGLEPKKIFRGEQLVVYGRYNAGGELALNLDARLTGEDISYSTSIVLPEVEASRPELERIWALAQLEEWAAAPVSSPRDEADQASLDLALSYQLVTSETSMILLEESALLRRGLQVHNRERVSRESSAPTAQRPAADASRPLTSGRAPNFGGGALDGFWILSVLVSVSLFRFFKRERNSRS